jgi:speckle-type POZ protein
MWDDCGETSDEENFSPEVTVKEMRNGLYHIHLDFGKLQDGYLVLEFEKKIQLCGSYSNHSYIITYADKENWLEYVNADDINLLDYEEHTNPGFILTVEEMLCDDPSISGSEMSKVNSRLIDDQEQPQTKHHKIGETSFLSDDLETQPSSPIHVWMKTDYKLTDNSESFMLPMVKFGTNEWKMEVNNPIIDDNFLAHAYRYSISIWIDFGTGTTREKNLKIMSKGLTEMFYSQELCDVHFDFKDSQTVGAHVDILSAGSSVFSSMFRSEFQESQTKKVNIIDIDIEVFRQLLIYLYTGSAPKLAEENMTQLLFEVADKYNIDNLKTECTDALLKRVNLDNAISLLIWSHIHSVAKLKEATLKFLAANSLGICSQPEWMNLIKNYPELCFLATQHMSKLLNKTNKTQNC